MIPNVNGQGSYYDGSDPRNYSSNINSNDFAYRAALQLQQTHPAYASAYQPSPTTSYLYTYQQPPAPTNASSMMPNISPRQPSLTAHNLSTLSAQQMYAEQAVVHQITTNPGYVQISEEELSKHQHSPPANLLNEIKQTTQTPPSSNSPSPGSLTREAGASTKKRARGSYNCSRCGGQKKGHQCTTTQIGEEELRKLYDNIQQLKQHNAYLEQELAKRDELIATLKEKENEKEPQHLLQRHTHPPPHHHQQHTKRRESYNKK